MQCPFFFNNICVALSLKVVCSSGCKHFGFEHKYFFFISCKKFVSFIFSHSPQVKIDFSYQKLYVDLVIREKKQKQKKNQVWHMATDPQPLDGSYLDTWLWLFENKTWFPFFPFNAQVGLQSGTRFQMVFAWASSLWRQDQKCTAGWSWLYVTKWKTQFSDLKVCCPF